MAQAMIDLANEGKKNRSKEAKGALELEGMVRTPYKNYPVAGFVPVWVQQRYILWRESNRMLDEHGNPVTDSDGHAVYLDEKERVYKNPKHDPQQFVAYGLTPKKRKEKKQKTAEEEAAQKERNRARHRNYYRTHTKPKMELMKKLAEAADEELKASVARQNASEVEELKPMGLEHDAILDFAAPTVNEEAEAEALAHTEAHLEAYDKQHQSIGHVREVEEVEEVVEEPEADAPKKSKKKSRKSSKN